MTFTDRKILITGGNSGIGRALAEALQAAGNRIVITGRKPASLAETLEANPGMAGHVLDVTDAAALAAFPAQLLADHPDLDAVILNAGIMEAEDYTADPVALDVALRTIETNLTAPIRLAAALLPHLRSRPQAALVTVSSGLAFVPKAGNPVYSATKAAIHSWTQSLRHQLRGTSVAVHEIAPPLVATELTPGQSQVAAAMPLEAFTAEVMGMLGAAEVPDEVLVSRVRFQRDAEAEGRFDAAFAAING
ncbi:SDR family oxidoreductase [Mangrovicoccus algicola]|uniref:SDR family oxidoreductase n=1 Tax=Mangrovicoccus algicola TaxID=2771008 RepID=A0A8J6Z903_9RHOB|nr:SDR family NAD(P)-dependent oxidoreductase [Mangrovicoccus algicola]MBE3638450.1 SDR family oxidoreductase [Mangrovicoccus algicola]